MRLTDDRYSGERSQFELALRMIRHEARTRSIRECTGLSDDRIRKLYATYFRNSGMTDIKRRRGKSPRQIARFVKNAENQLQATTLVALFAAGLLIRIDQDDFVHPCWPRPDVEFGHRLCRAYETYLLLHRRPALSFEWAWNLLAVRFPQRRTVPRKLLNTAALSTSRMPTRSTAASARPAKSLARPISGVQSGRLHD